MTASSYRAGMAAGDVCAQDSLILGRTRSQLALQPVNVTMPAERVAGRQAALQPMFTA
jgi:hypothetical protein